MHCQRRQSKLFCFNLSTGEFVRSKETEFQRVPGLLIHPDGKRLIIVGRRANTSHAIQIRDLQTLKLLHNLGEGTGGIDRQPLFAIAGDHNESVPGDYWVKHYVSPVDRQGRFDIEIAEPEELNGELRLWFVFINGEITGNGKQLGAGNVTKIPYRFHDGKWVLVR